MTGNGSLTFAAQAPEPHLHLDNRALIVHGGNRTLRVGAASFPWLFDTLQVIADEGRASRSSGQLFAGGHADADGRVTLYVGIGDEFVAVAVAREVFESLKAALDTGRRHS
jgi:hypothetical protein